MRRQKGSKASRCVNVVVSFCVSYAQHTLLSACVRSAHQWRETLAVAHQEARATLDHPRITLAQSTELCTRKPVYVGALQALVSDRLREDRGERAAIQRQGINACNKDVARKLEQSEYKQRYASSKRTAMRRLCKPTVQSLRDLCVQAIGERLSLYAGQEVELRKYMCALPGECVTLLSCCSCVEQQQSSPLVSVFHHPLVSRLCLGGKKITDKVLEGLMPAPITPPVAKNEDVRWEDDDALTDDVCVVSGCPRLISLTLCSTTITPYSIRLISLQLPILRELVLHDCFTDESGPLALRYTLTLPALTSLTLSYLCWLHSRDVQTFAQGVHSARHAHLAQPPSEGLQESWLTAKWCASRLSVLSVFGLPEPDGHDDHLKDAAKILLTHGVVLLHEGEQVSWAKKL
jgi:hypothetical protein